MIDSHVHLWDPTQRRHPWLDSAPDLNRRIGPEDLRAAHGGAATGVIVVEADCAREDTASETTWLAGLAHGSAHGVVGVIAAARLEDDGIGADLELLAQTAAVCGVRRLIQGESDGFALSKTFVRNVRALAAHDLTMDLCVRSHQLAEVTELVRLAPEVSFVLDHCGKPSIDNDEFAQWAADLRALAALPNIACKLSGLTTEAGDRQDHVPAYLEEALAQFGPDRAMIGSDWPVCTARITWTGWADIVDGVIAHLSRDERADVLGGTAARVYRLT